MNKSCSNYTSVDLGSRKRFVIFCLTSVLGLIVADPAQAQSTWTTAGTGTWTDSSKWTGGVPSGTAVTFNTSGSNGAETIYLNGNQSAALMTFQNTGATTLLGGTSSTPAANTLTLTSGLTVAAGAGVVTIGDTAATPTAQVNLSLGASESFTNNSTSLLTIANGVTSATSGATRILTVAGSGNETFLGVISNNGGGGTLGITDANTGTVTLSGANTYGGVTTVSAGTLNITGSNSGGGSYSVGAGTLTLGSGAGTVVASTVTLGGSSSFLNLNGGILMVGTTGITATAASPTINFNGGTLKSSGVSVIGSNNHIEILSGGGTIDTSGGNITSSSTVGDQAASVGTLTIQGGNTFIAPLGTAGSTSYTLSGAGTTLKISGATATTTSTVVTTGTSTVVDMNGNSDSFGGIAGSGSIINSGAVGKTLTLTGAGGSNFSGNYTGGINATTSGSGALVVNLSTGTQTLSGANLFNGGTSLTKGTLLLANSLALQNSVLTYNNAGGAISFGTLTSATLGGLTGAQSLPTGSLTSLTINNTTSPAAYSGVIADGTTPGLVLNETGSTTSTIETLTGNNIYTGGTIVTSGGLQGENTGTTNVIQAFGTGQITLNGGELYAKANGSANGQTIITGDGTTGNNIVVGGNTIMDVNNAGANTGNKIQYNNLTIGASTLNVTGTNTYALQFAGTTTLTGNATITSLGTFNANVYLLGAVGDGGLNYSLTKAGPTTLFLNGANTYGGGTTLTAGTIQGANAAATNVLLAFGTGAIALNGGTLNLRGDGTGSGQTIITGNGTTGNNVVVGASTTINAANNGSANTGNAVQFNNLSIGASTLNVTSSNAYNVQFAGTTTLTGNATFNNTTAGLTLSGNLSDGSGGFGFTKTGAGALNLTGTNGYSGPTTLNTGTTTFQGAGALPSATAINLGTATLSILNDGTGSNGTINLGNNITATATGTVVINVGNNGSGNTGNTVAFGALSNINVFVPIFTFTGSNGYLQSYVSLALPGGGGQSTYLNPTTTSVTILGNVTNTSSGSGHYDTLILEGSTSGNIINGIISDSPSFTGTINNNDTRVTTGGTATWTLAGANTYHGPTVVSNGTTLNLTGSLGGNSTLAGGTAISTSGTGVFNESSAGSITGASTFTTTGTGTSVLAGSNSYSGVTSVGSGTTLSLTGSLAGNTAISTAGTGVFNESASGSISGASASIMTAGTGTSVLAGSNSYNGVTSVGSGTTLSLTGSLSGNTAITTAGSGVFNEGATGSISGSTASVATAGSGTSVLAGTNSYGGVTSVGGGTVLNVVNEVSLYNNNPSMWTAANIVVNSGGTLDLNVGGIGQFTNADVNAIDSLGTSTGGFLSGSILGLDTTSGNFTLTNLVNPNSGANVLGLSKYGANTLTLTGTISYTGPTTIYGGNLVVNGSGTGNNLILNGATLTYSAPGTNTLTYDSTTFDGASSIANTVATDTLNLGTVTRVAGGTLDFTNITGTINSSLANAGSTGIVSPWAVTGTGTGLNYAVSTGGAISANSVAGESPLPTSGGNASNNYTVTTGGATLTGSVTGNTLQVLNTDVTAITIATSTGNNLTLNGILNSGGSGGSLTISGAGSLIIGANQELDILNNAQGVAISAPIVDNPAGASSVVVSSLGGGGVTLSGANTFTGGLYVNSGGLALGTGSGGGASNIIYLGAAGSLSSATLSLNNSTLANAINVAPGGARNLLTAGSPGTFSGAITLTGGSTLTVENGGINLTVTGGLTGTGNLLLTSSTGSRASSDIVSGGDVNINGTITATGNNGTITVASNIDSGVNGIFVNFPVGSNPNGALFLSGTNTNTGPITVTAGTLELNLEASLYNGDNTQWTAANISAGSTGKIIFDAGNSGGFTSSDLNGLVTNLTGSVATGTGLQAGSGIGVNTASGTSTTISTSIANTTGTGGGSIGFTKLGTGTLVLSGPANNYTGGTTTSGGNLISGANGALGTGFLSVSSNGSTTIVDLAGFNQTVGALSLAPGSNSSFSTSAPFAGINGLVIGNSSGSSTLTLTGGVSETTSGNRPFITVTTLDLNNATQTFNIASGANVVDNLAITSVIQNGALTKTGAGGLGLTGANTYTGATTVSGGTLFIGTGGTAGSLASGGSIIVNTAATLDFNRADTITEGTDFASGISGATGIVKQNGQGTLVLNGTNNSYTGGTSISSGTVQFAKVLSMPSAGAVTVSKGAVVAVNAGGSGEFTATGTGAGTIAGLFAGTGGQGAAVTLASGSSVGIDTTNAGGTLTYSGNITNAGVGLRKLGTGTLILSGTGNTYTGPTGVAAGTLAAGATNAFGTNSAVSLANVAGATLNITGFNNQVLSLSGGGTTGGSVVLGSAVLTLANSANNGLSTTFAGGISGTGGSVVESGTGTQILSGAGLYTYTGGTGITSGTLQFAQVAAMPAFGTVAVSGTGTLAVNAGGAGEFTGSATTGAGSIAGLFAGTGGQGAGVTYTTGSSIGVDTTNAGGSLSLTTNLGGNAGLAKLGTGTLVVTGTNTYAGPTTVNNGTFNLGNSGSTGALYSGLGTPGALVLGGGTFTYSRTGTNTQSFNGLTVNAGASTISETASSGETIALGAITRNVGGTVNFAPTGSDTITTTTTNTNGIIGGYATFNGSTWAVGSSAGAATAITGLATGSYLSTTTGGTASTYANANMDVTTGGTAITLAGAITPNTIRFNEAKGDTLALTGTNVISGGILNTANVGNNNSSINGGTLQGSSAVGADLAIINNDASAALFINSTIVDNTTTGVTLATNAASTTVEFTAANTYHGTTTIGSGVTLQLNGGSIVNSAVSINSGGTLMFDKNGSESGFVSSISGAGGINIDNDNANTTVFADLNNTYTGQTVLATRTTFKAGVASLYDAAGNQISGAFGVNSGLVMNNSFDTVDLNGFNTQVGSLTGLAGAGQIILNAATLTTGGDNSSTLYASFINGTGGLTKIGTGTQQLTGGNTYTGQTIVNNGALQVTAGNSVAGIGGSGPLGVGSNVTINANQAGATALLGITNQTVAIGSLTFGGQGGTSTSTNNVTIGIGALILGGNLTYDATNNSKGSVITASVTGGWLELNGNRTFTIGSSNNSNGADLTISAIIDDSTDPYTTFHRGAIAYSGGNSLTKTGSGVLVLASATYGNTYTGATNINAGTLSVSLVNGASSTNYSTPNQLGWGNVINMGSGSATDTLLYTGATATLGGTGTHSYTINVLGAGTNTIKNGGSGTLTLADSIVKNGTTLNITGAVDIAGVISGSLPNSDMNYNNATSTVSVAGTYTGPTHIFNTSTVTNGVNDALPDTNGGASGGNSSLILGDASETGAGKTNIYALGGYNQTLGGLTSTQGANADTNEVIGNSSTLSTLTLAIASGTDTYSGLLGNGVAGTSNANNLALVSNGSGTLVLNRANTYTGGTTVSSGVLQLGATGALGSTAASLAVNNGGTVDLNGFSPTVGALTLGSGGSTIAASSPGTLSTTGVTVNGTGNTMNSGATVVGNAIQSANSALAVNGALTGTDALAAGTTSLSGTGSVSGLVTLNGGGNSIFSSGTLSTGGIAVNNTGNTIMSGTVTGLTTMASSSSLTVNNGATLSPVAGVNQGSSSALTVNGSIGADSLGASATLAGTGSTGAVTLIGSNNVSSTGTLTTSSISVSGTGNVIGSGTVAGNTTINSGGFLSVSSGATASGAVGISNGGSLGGSGTTGAVTLASGGAVNLTDSVIGTLTVGGLTTSGGGSLSFDIRGGASTAVDKIADTGSLTISGVTTINISNLGGIAQSLANGTNTYQLLTFASGSAVLSNFNLATTTLDSKNLSLSLSGNVLYLNLTSPVTNTSYTLATSAASTLLHAGASTALTTTLTNTGTGTADSVNYSGVGASAALGSVTGATINSPPSLANGNSSVSNTNQTFSTTAGTSGTATISSTGTVTDAAFGGTPSGTSTGTSITVYSGFGVWSTNGSGTWGSAPTATPVNWTAAGGTPGVTAGFTGVDTATFGAQTATAITVGLNGAAPNLNAITFSSPDTAYTLAQNYAGGTGTSSITLSGTTPSINVTNPGSSLTAGTQTISAPLILGATTSLNVAANQKLNISGQISSTGTFGLTNSGPGTTTLTSDTGNTYTGPTTITGGTVFIKNTSGSATGTGAVTVSGSSTVLKGHGEIDGAVTLSGGATLFSGSTSAGTGPGTGMKLTSALAVNGAALTFQLSNGTNSATYANPNTTTSYLDLGATGTVSFSGSDTINLVDLSNGGLTLRLRSPYLLISGNSSSVFYGLVIRTSSGAVGLSQDGFQGSVLGVWTGVADDYTSFTFNQFGPDGVTPLAPTNPGNTTGAYISPFLYLSGGNLEVVPEPSTWALMIGGLALLVVIQRRKNKQGL